MKLIHIFLAKLIRAYQLWISPLIGGSSCRYYPTCSEYMLWLLQGNTSLKWIFLLTFYRLMRCNPFAKGGIDYPVVWRSCHTHSPLKLSKLQKIPISFWLIPQGRILQFLGMSVECFYLIKFKQEGYPRV